MVGCSRPSRGWIGAGLWAKGEAPGWVQKARPDAKAGGRSVSLSRHLQACLQHNRRLTRRRRPQRNDDDAPRAFCLGCPRHSSTLHPTPTHRSTGDDDDADGPFGWRRGGRASIVLGGRCDRPRRPGERCRLADSMRLGLKQQQGARWTAGVSWAGPRLLGRRALRLTSPFGGGCGGPRKLRRARGCRGSSLLDPASSIVRTHQQGGLDRILIPPPPPRVHNHRVGPRLRVPTVVGRQRRRCSSGEQPWTRSTRSATPSSS